MSKRITVYTGVTMTQILVAGIDTSTQSTKIRITDAETGKLVRFGQAKHPEGTSIHPDRWWEAFLKAKEQAGGLDDVSALSVGGQQHGMVLLDKQGNIVRDALLWNDTRSAPEATQLIESLQGKSEQNTDKQSQTLEGKRNWVRAVGLSPVASFTVTKIAWVANHEPELANKVAAICLPHDWLSWRIAGYGPSSPSNHSSRDTVGLDKLFTDRSDASGTGYFDPTTNNYRRDLIKLAFGRDDVILPKVLNPNEIGAYADPEIAGKNVAGGCLIAPGGADNAMAALGLNMGIGDVSISLGTSGVAAAVCQTPIYDMTTAVAGFADCTGHWLPLACTINGSRIIDAGCKALSVDYEQFANLSAQSIPGAQGITLIPYFDGERTPDRPNSTASIYGLTLANTKPSNIARAFTEGLLCSQRDCLELIKSLGVTVKKILLIGGGAKSSAIRALAPSILGSDVTLPKTDEYVAIGAARQAAWTLSGKEYPPIWQNEIETTLSGEPNEEIYKKYLHYRNLEK